MLFKYDAVDQKGSKQSGSIEAVSRDVAISSLQNRGFSISTVKEVSKNEGGLLSYEITMFTGVSNRDVVFLSREIATLFEAQVSALRVFTLLAAESENQLLRKILAQVADDLQAGASISKALARHPKVFTSFYVNMVRAGEEAGKLDQTLLYLADYLDRSYEIGNKARNALIYPAFVIGTFFVVMALMLTMVIPNIATILTDAGQDIPIYTKIVIGLSDFFVNYGIFFLILIAIGGFFLFKYIKTDRGRAVFGRFMLEIPYVGGLYQKLYLSRIADNLSTMLLSGISMVQATDITASVVGNSVYEEILSEISTAVKGGGTISNSMAHYPEIPGIMTAMVKIGEETGEMGAILKTLAKFYQREVSNMVDNLVVLIEPMLIVVLGVSVAILLAAVLIPIYNVTSAI